MRLRGPLAKTPLAFLCGEGWSERCSVESWQRDMHKCVIVAFADLICVHTGLSNLCHRVGSPCVSLPEGSIAQAGAPDSSRPLKTLDWQTAAECLNMLLA